MNSIHALDTHATSSYANLYFPDERTEAAEHLDFAANEFREMNMQPSLERARARQQSL